MTPSSYVPRYDISMDCLLAILKVGVSPPEATHNHWLSDDVTVLYASY
jgi:hypothetical protein